MLLLWFFNEEKNFHFEGLNFGFHLLFASNSNMNLKPKPKWEGLGRSNKSEVLLRIIKRIENGFYIFKVIFVFCSLRLTNKNNLLNEASQTVKITPSLKTWFSWSFPKPMMF